MIRIGPFNIYWYSFIILVAVLIGILIAVNYSKKINVSYNSIIDLVIYTVIVSIIGSRAYFVLFKWSYYSNHIKEIFMLWRGGLAIYGGIIAGIMYIFHYCKKNELPFVQVLDILSLSLLLGQAIGRWGNFFNQEAYGAECTKELLISMHIPDFIINGMFIDGAYRIPTFLFESVWCFIGVIILFFIRKKSFRKVGKQVSFYLVWYGIGRFFIEALRSDSLYFGNYKVSQLVSLILVIIGIISSVVVFIKNKDKTKYVGNASGRI